MAGARVAALAPTAIPILLLLLAAAARAFEGDVLVGPLSLMGQQHVSVSNASGAPFLLAFGGYQLVRDYVHRDINDVPDRIFIKRVEFSRDVHALDVSTGVWSVLEPADPGAERPLGRIMHSMSADANGTSITVFGGSHCIRTDTPSPFILFAEALPDVWTFHLDERRWEAVVPPGDAVPLCDSPASRAAATPPRAASAVAAALLLVSWRYFAAA